MFRESLPEKTGMLFVFAEPAPHHFWMKNTMIPLDMIWLDEAGQRPLRLRQHAAVQGGPLPDLRPGRPVRSVLEIAGGMAEKEGTSSGR